MEKLKPVRICWSYDLECRLLAAGYTPEIIEEYRPAEVYQAGELTVITRINVLNDKEFEVVWLAAMGKGVDKWINVFLDGAARAGAKYIRIHPAKSEKGVLRYWRKFNPVKVADGECVTTAYRVSLGDRL